MKKLLLLVGCLAAMLLNQSCTTDNIEDEASMMNDGINPTLAPPPPPAEHGDDDRDKDTDDN